MQRRGWWGRSLHLPLHSTQLRESTVMRKDLKLSRRVFFKILSAISDFHARWKKDYYANWAENQW